MAALLLAVGCTRARPPLEERDAGLSPTTPAGPAAAASPIVITAPQSGSTVGSPVRIEGTARLGAGQILAAQVRSHESGNSIWRGTGALAVDGQGRFSGEVGYHLATAVPGVIEVDVVDPVGGTVIERRQVEVSLGAAP
jgi:hypothetical protein